MLIFLLTVIFDSSGDPAGFKISQIYPTLQMKSTARCPNPVDIQ